MTDRDRLTSAFYAENAEAYAKKSREENTARLEKFMAALPVGGHVLELGCGGGHHSKIMLKAGFHIYPTDGSPEMARQAERHLNHPVKVMAFADLEAQSQFDGIWANACLLHVKRQELADILRRIRKALKPGGIFYASFKAGIGEGRDQFNRYYNYPTPQWLNSTYKSASWENPEIEQADGGGYDSAPTKWLHVTSGKPN